MSNITPIFMTENMFSNNKNNLKISKEVIRIGKLKNDRQHNDQRKNGKQQSPKHRQLKIEKH